MKPPKIAFLFDKFPCLTETFLAREVEALRNLGLNIEIFAFEAGKGARKIPRPGAIYRVSPSQFRKVCGRILAREIAAENFTHIHATWANHVALSAQACAGQLGLSWSFAAHARDLWVEGGDLRAKLASAKFAFACTRAGEKRLQNYGDNVIYAPHGLSLENYPFAKWQPKNPPQILGVGRLVPKKGWKTLVEARQFLPSESQIKIIGDGPLQTELPPEILLGALSHAQVIAQMQAASCLVLPSIQTFEGDRDGLANVILEAAALGLPVVTTDAGSASDFVDENTGWLCQGGDAKILAQTIQAVYEDETETRRRCQNARLKVENEFDARKNALVLARAFGFLEA